MRSSQRHQPDLSDMRFHRQVSSIQRRTCRQDIVDDQRFPHRRTLINFVSFLEISRIFISASLAFHLKQAPYIIHQIIARFLTEFVKMKV